MTFRKQLESTVHVSLSLIKAYVIKGSFKEGQGGFAPLAKSRPPLELNINFNEVYTSNIA